MLVFAMLALPVLAQTTTCTPPVGAELEKFPLKVGKLSTVDMATMSLSPKKLDKPVAVYNHHRNIRGGCWELNTLSAGTIVLVDAKGVIRYKDDCGNRVVEVESRPQPEKVLQLQAFDPRSVKNSLGKKSNGSATSPGPSAWDRFWDNAGKAWNSTWGGMGSLLGTLIPLLIVLAVLIPLGYLVYRAIQNRRGGQSGGQNPPAPAPVQQPQVVPQAPLAPVPPVQQPAAPAQQGLAAVLPVQPPPPQPPVQPTSGAIQPNPAAPQVRKFRFTNSGTGIYSRMEGYQNLRVEETATGISINADHV